MAGVEVIRAVVDDLDRFRTSGHLPAILKKLLQIERNPKTTGHPLGSDLATYRKLTFGDRGWRIIFRPEADGSGALVWVIGDRDDMECYKLAKKRIAAMGDHPFRVRLDAAVELFDRVIREDITEEA